MSISVYEALLIVMRNHIKITKDKEHILNYAEMMNLLLTQIMKFLAT